MNTTMTLTMRDTVRSMEAGPTKVAVTFKRAAAYYSVDATMNGVVAALKDSFACGKDVDVEYDAFSNQIQAVK